MGGGPDLDGGGGRAGSRIASRLLPIVLQIIAVTIGMGWATKWNATDNQDQFSILLAD